MYLNNDLMGGYFESLSSCISVSYSPIRIKEMLIIHLLLFFRITFIYTEKNRSIEIAERYWQFKRHSTLFQNKQYPLRHLLIEIIFSSDKRQSNCTSKYRAIIFVNKTFISAICIWNNNQLHLLTAICMKLIIF